MRAWRIGGCVLLAALAGARAAVAQEQRFGPMMQERPEQQDLQRPAQRPMPMRDPRAAPEPGQGRMSFEERQQLRRDIQDAGREIYRHGPQGPGRGEQRRRGRN